MTTRKNPRKDFAEVAHDVFMKAIGKSSEPELSPEKKAAIESGRRGGLKGGSARAKKLTAKQRSEIAKKAAQSRWGKS